MDHGSGQDKASLRARAEKLLATERMDDEDLTLEQVRELLHELSVHRVELDMQNDELRRAQHNLELSRDQFADLYDFAPLGYVVLDQAGKVVSINLTGARMVGRERAAIVGRSFSRYLTPQSVQSLRHHITQCLGDSDEVRSEVSLQPRKGAGIIVELRSVRWLDADGELQFRTSMTDITARRHAEDQLCELNNSLERQVAERTAQAERRAAQLQLLARRLAQVEHRERRRLAKLLHDHLQQMLVAARMTTALTRRRNENAELDAHLKQIDDLVNESISVSRSLTLDLCPPVLHDVGFTAGLQWLARFMQEKHQLEVDLRVEPAAELEDPEMRVIVFEAARELLFNIVKHAQAARAHLAAQRTAENQIQLHVRDEGVGFDPSTLDAGIMNGFGLFNVRQRVELMGGRLHIESSLGEGTQVTIFVPARAPEQPEDELLADTLLYSSISRRRKTIDQPQASGAAKIRVLLVDDHEIVREGLASVLLEEPDIEIVAEARDGQEAVELAAAMRPDVVLMDVSMPRMDGIEATRRIKSQSPEIRVIGLSMHEEGDLARAMRQAGASAYMSKNGCSDELVTAIRNEPGGES